MRLEPLYRCTFAPTESWHVQLVDGGGTEAQGFLLVEGRSEGQLTGRLRAANYHRQRTDGTLIPEFRGVLETDDGAVIVFAWHGYGVVRDAGSRQLLGSMTHLSEDDRYRWLNQATCVLAGEVRPQGDGGFDVVLDVAELVWEPTDRGALDGTSPPRPAPGL